MAMKSNKGHFAAAMQKLAKLRSGKLQHGVPKHAPLGGKAPMGSKVSGGPGLTVQSTEGQTALNPKQQGASGKNAQTKNLPKR